jgi:hypothetical protein
MSIAKGLAEKILSPVPSDKAFHFYLAEGKPLGVSSSDLKDFGSKLKTVDVVSLEFHTKRGDFEKWVYMLGDGELTKSLMRLREANFSEKRLRSELVKLVQTRVRQLQKPQMKR